MGVEGLVINRVVNWGHVPCRSTSFLTLSFLWYECLFRCTTLEERFGDMVGLEMGILH